MQTLQQSITCSSSSSSASCGMGTTRRLFASLPRKAVSCCVDPRPYRSALLSSGVRNPTGWCMPPRGRPRCVRSRERSRVASHGDDGGSGDGRPATEEDSAGKIVDPRDERGAAAGAGREPTAFDSAQTLLQLWLFVLPLAFGGVSIFGQLLGVPVADMDAGTKAIGTCSSQALQLAGTLWILGRVPPQQRPTAFHLSPAVLRDGVLGGVAAVVLVGAVVKGGGGEAAASSSAPTLAPFTITLLALQTVVLGPITEELIYRGFLLPQLLRPLSTPSAVCLSAALFSMAHCSPDNFAALFALGVVLGGVYVSGRNLTASVIAHALYNAFALTELIVMGRVP